MTVRNEDETFDGDDEEELEPTPYENEYRQSLGDPDDDEEIEDPIDMVTPKSPKKGLAEKRKDASASDTHDYKKRYGDLKKHYDTKLNEWKQNQELLEAKLQMAENSTDLPPLPKTEEELTEFRDKYPDVYDVVETISALKASDRVREIETKLDDLKVKEQEAIVQTAEQELISLHSDFGELKESEDFLTWLDDQHPNISDGIYKNNTDAQWAARVVDLYKSDKGTTSKTRSKQRSKATRSKAAPKKSAAEAVTKTKQRRYIEELQDDNKVWTVQEISRLKPNEFAALEKDIDRAVKDGRVVQSL